MFSFLHTLTSCLASLPRVPYVYGKFIQAFPLEFLIIPLQLKKRFGFETVRLGSVSTLRSRCHVFVPFDFNHKSLPPSAKVGG